MALLCFRLFGPMAAWGTGEKGPKLRPSQRHPGRGAVLGLVAAALGIPPTDETALDLLGQGLWIAIASHGERRIVEEFRTTQMGLSGKKAALMTRCQRLEKDEGATSLTTRQSIEDGLWRVFLMERGKNSFSLDRIAQALRRPVFDLYLGRREFPLALPPDPQIVDCGLTEALETCRPIPDWDKSYGLELNKFHANIRRRVVKSGPYELRWDDGFPQAPDGGSMHQVVDDPFRRSMWTFRARSERIRRIESKIAFIAAERNLKDYYFEEVV